MKIPVHRVIPFSNVEGMGNRTSIFVQGCNANCLYCHNSETIPMMSDEVTDHSVESLLEVIKGNMPFIRGITVSGGEASLYHKFLIELFDQVHKLGLTCYIDTNGFFDYEDLSPLIEVTDQFLYDVKGIGSGLEKECFSDLEYGGRGLVKNYKERFVEGHEHLKNLKALLKLNKIEEVRLVYLKGYYNEKEVVGYIGKAIEKYPDVLFKLIRVHLRGLPKVRALELKGCVPSKSDIDELERYASELGICRIEKIY